MPLFTGLGLLEFPAACTFPLVSRCLCRYCGCAGSGFFEGKLDLDPEILRRRRRRIVEVDLEIRRVLRLVPAPGKPFTTEFHIGLDDILHGAGVNRGGKDTTRDGLEGDAGRGLGLSGDSDAGVIPDLLRWRDVGVVVTQADVGRVGPEEPERPGPPAQRLPGGAAVFIRADMPDAGDGSGFLADDLDVHDAS